MSSSMITASELSSNESQTASCPTRLSLVTSEHSLIQDVQSFIAALPRWLVVDFPANPSQSQESAPEPMIPATCGPQHLTPYAWLDPDTASLRTFQACLPLDILSESFATLPKAGIAHDGVVYRQPSWERRISEIASGLWLTPAVGMIRGEKYVPETRFRHWTEGRQVHLTQQVRDPRMWPTPRANKVGGYSSVRFRPTLEQTVRAQWPTPTVDDSKQVTRDSGAYQSLTRAVRHASTPAVWPTPRAGSDTLVGGTGHWQMLQGTELEAGRGKLNPTWVDWLMGWIPGWTDLEPLATDKFQSWLQQHGIY